MIGRTTLITLALALGGCHLVDGSDRADVESGPGLFDDDLEMVMFCDAGDSDLRALAPLGETSTVVIARGESDTLDVDVRLRRVPGINLILASASPTSWRIDTDGTPLGSLLVSGDANQTTVQVDVPPLTDFGVLERGTSPDFDATDGPRGEFIEFIKRRDPALFLGCESIERAEIVPKG